jgi:hypothetical protein
MTNKNDQVPSILSDKRAAIDAFRKKLAEQAIAVAPGQRARVNIGIDATGSREKAWRQGAGWTRAMLEEAAKIGGLEIQVVCYYGVEFEHSNWTPNLHELTDWFGQIACETGNTQIARFLEHVSEEHKRKPIRAVIFIGDMCEEMPQTLYDAAKGLPPMFLFQEGDDPMAEKVFRKLADLTGGQYFKFTADAWRDVADLLREIAVYAAGGVKALENRNTDSARKLLMRLK